MRAFHDEPFRLCVSTVPIIAVITLITRWAVVLLKVATSKVKFYLAMRDNLYKFSRDVFSLSRDTSPPLDKTDLCVSFSLAIICVYLLEALPRALIYWQTRARAHTHIQFRLSRKHRVGRDVALKFLRIEHKAICILQR